MASAFQIEDLFNAIIALESIGHRNYKRLSEHTSDFKLKQYFTTLSEMELKHRDIFEKLKGDVVTFPSTVISAEYHQYLQSLLAHTLRFVKLFEVQMVNPDVYEDFDLAFDLAVDLEKDAILFLSEMKMLLPNYQAQVLNQLLDEERSHLAYLYAYRTSLEETSRD